MSDRIEKAGNSLIQHGKENDRVYILEVANDEASQLIAYVDQLADEQNYTKIIAKIPEELKPLFLEHNYKEEASIPRFFKGETTGLFMAKYLHVKRSQHNQRQLIGDIILKSIEKNLEKEQLVLNDDYSFDVLSEKDATEMAQIYSTTFSSYPFPIDQPEYIKDTMKSHVIYFGIRHENKLIALASCEMNKEKQNVEFTDFATLQKYQGNNLAYILIQRMEKHMRQLNYKTAYTIARSVSYGMNISFGKANFKFAGTLVNNTNIAGSIESMNIWFKHLDKEQTIKF